jgi:hypothetical protein
MTTDAQKAHQKELTTATHSDYHSALHSADKTEHHWERAREWRSAIQMAAHWALLMAAKMALPTDSRLDAHSAHHLGHQMDSKSVQQTVGHLALQTAALTDLHSARR